MPQFLIEGNIDWKKLRQQKLHILEILDDEESSITAEQHISLEGVVCLIDSIQDEAVQSGIWTEKEIFNLEVADG